MYKRQTLTRSACGAGGHKPLSQEEQFALFRSRKSDGYKEDLAISKAQQFSGYNHGL